MSIALRTILGGILGLALIILIPATASQVGAQAPGTSAAHMQGHYSQVDQIQEAVIRGDLESAKAPAQALADHKSTEGLKPGTESQQESMRAAAREAATAKELRVVAKAVASMAAACGNCHKASKVTPAVAEPPEVAGEGTTAHMLAHQRAADYMYQGLIIPSDEMWSKGVDLLKTSPLMKDKFPDDPQLTDKIVNFEGRVHTVADRGKRAKDMKARVNLYGEYVSSCAECHSLHGRAWGPGVSKP